MYNYAPKGAPKHKAKEAKTVEEAQQQPAPLPKALPGQSHWYDGASNFLLWFAVLAVFVPKLLRMVFMTMGGWSPKRILRRWDSPMTWVISSKAMGWLNRFVPAAIGISIYLAVQASVQASEQAAVGKGSMYSLFNSIIGLIYSLLAIVAMFILVKKTFSLSNRLGNAAFWPVEHEFGRTKDSIAAMVVKRADKAKARKAFVRSWWPWQWRLAFLSWEMVSRHILIIGNSGSRKTTGVFSQVMASSKVPWIYQDQKADLPFREDHTNVPVWGLDSRGYETRSGVWNPMEEVTGPEDSELMAAILFPDRGDQNDWIVRGARMMFDGLIKARHWSSLQELAVFVESNSVTKVIGLLPPGWKDTVKDEKTRTFFQQTLLEVLRPWTSQRIAEITQGHSTVDLAGFIARGGYLMSNEKQELRTPVTLFWAMLFQRLRTRPDGSQKLLLLLDEFGDAGKIPDMENALALLRSKQVGIVAGIQTEGLLKKVYGDSYEAVMQGFGTKFILPRNSDPKLRQELTRELGEWTGKQGFGFGVQTILAFIPTGINKAHEHKIPLVPVDQWGAWAEGNALLARANRPTWWIPQGVLFTPAPLGAPKPQAEDWREAERNRITKIAGTEDVEASGTSEILDSALEA